FQFERDSYQIKVSYRIENDSEKPWVGNVYSQLVRTDVQPEQKGVSSLTTYFGAAISTPEKAFQKITFKEIKESALNRVVQGGWLAMIQHYFVSAWIPLPSATHTYYTHHTSNGLYVIGMMSPDI